jgi:hypothetical protein
MYLHKLNALLRICLGFILITATGFLPFHRVKIQTPLQAEDV